MKNSKYFIGVLFVFLTADIFAFNNFSDGQDTSYRISPDDEILSMIDSTMESMYFQSLGFVSDTSLLNVYNYAPDSIPSFTDSVYRTRLAELDRKTPISLTYNKYVHAFIDLYADRRRELTSTMLGLAPVYFPLFEKTLDKYNMPLELKYLAIVESALNPVARSRAGAKGLWQFMYTTGKMYGLEVSSYHDDRMDPIKSTIAACEFMTDLYGMYGDWNLVLAAYNSGPGNVNKAIRRSGGKKDFWEIRAFLPRETRSYVPAFIAVNYVMNYHAEHNLYPKLPEIYCIKRDTIMINTNLTFDRISKFIGLPVEYIEFLNPSYKLGFIPAAEQAQSLCLPANKIGLYLTNEKAMYAELRRQVIRDSIAGVERQNLAEITEVHRVRSGENLGLIAQRYNCSVSQIMDWNHMRSTRINPGDKLTIYTNANGPSINKKKSEPKTYDSGNYEYYTIQSGDTLWDLAKRFDDVTVSELKKLNSNLNFNRLRPGMKVKVKAI